MPEWDRPSAAQTRRPWVADTHTHTQTKETEKESVSLASEQSDQQLPRKPCGEALSLRFKQFKHISLPLHPHPHPISSSPPPPTVGGPGPHQPVERCQRGEQGRRGQVLEEKGSIQRVQRIQTMKSENSRSSVLECEEQGSGVRGQAWCATSIFDISQK